MQRRECMQRRERMRPRVCMHPRDSVCVPLQGKSVCSRPVIQVELDCRAADKAEQGMETSPPEASLMAVPPTDLYDGPHLPVRKLRFSEGDSALSHQERLDRVSRLAV